MIGKKFGHWTVVGNAPKKGKNAYYLCVCKCGLQANVRGDALRNGRSKGCPSCRAKESYVKPKSFKSGPRGFALHNPNKTHGQSRTRVYRIWKGMTRRVRNNEAGYGKYSVHLRWLTENNGFVNFLADMGQPPSDKHSIDRINNSRGYYPGNCRWATAREQARNRTRNRCIEIDGERMLAVEAAEQFNLNVNCVYRRLDKGWTARQAVGLDTRPPRPSRYGEKAPGVKLTAEKVKSVRARIKSGASTRKEEATLHNVSYWTICGIMQNKSWTHL